MTVSQAASPPVAESQSVTATSGSPSDITLKATDPDGNALTYAIVSGPKSGTITDLNKDTGTLVYTPTDGFTGQDRFTFKASDGTTDSNTAQVTVKEPTDKSQVTVKEPTDKSQVTVKEPTDKSQDANIGKKFNNPKETPGQDSPNTNSLISQGLSGDNG